jgi:hypothetical protein
MPSRAGRHAGGARELRPFSHPCVVVLREHAVPFTLVYASVNLIFCVSLGVQS